MKVIAMAGREKYICEVSHSEIEKFLNLYYNEKKRMDIGDQVDLGRGYDYAHDISDALTKLQDLIKSNAKVIQALTSGLNIKTIMEDGGVDNG